MEKTIQIFKGQRRHKTRSGISNLIYPKTACDLIIPVRGTPKQLSVRRPRPHPVTCSYCKGD